MSKSIVRIVKPNGIIEYSINGKMLCEFNLDNPCGLIVDLDENAVNTMKEHGYSIICDDTNK